MPVRVRPSAPSLFLSSPDPECVFGAWLQLRGRYEPLRCRLVTLSGSVEAPAEEPFEAQSTDPAAAVEALTSEAEEVGSEIIAPPEVPSGDESGDASAGDGGDPSG